MGRTTALLLVAAFAMSACTPETDMDTTTSLTAVTTSSIGETTTTETPSAFDGEAIIGVGLAVGTLNPFSGNAFGETSIAGQAVWATVYDILPETWERVPVSVTSLPSQTPGAIEVSADGAMTVRYEIQSGAAWSDGTPISGSDLAFTAQVMRELAEGGDPTVDPVMASIIATDSVERIVWITFSEPSLVFEDALSVILPSHVINSAADLRASDGFDWPSGGPFMVEDSQQAGVLRLVRNPHYWRTDDAGNQLPYLDRLTIISGNEPGLEMELFSGRAADVIVLPPDPALIESVPDDALIQQVPTPIIEHLTFQFGEGRGAINPLSSNDLFDYRKAIALAIDRPVLVEETGIPCLAA